jgi:hypothetical protein
MYGVTHGSWTGAFDPREGAVLYAGSEFDETSANLFGTLPTDAGHRVYIEATRRGHLAGLPVSLATRMTVASGRPRNYIGDSDDGLIFLLPRGAAGRGPMQTQANVRLATTVHGVDLMLDVFDVFDRRSAASVDEVYATGAIHPIDHGDQSDLVFLHTDTGAPASRHTAFDYPTTFLPPLTIVLGARAAFQ